MGWLPVQLLLEKETAILTHIIINNSNPEYLAYKMNVKYARKESQEQAITRRIGPSKLGIMPKQVGKTNTTKYHFRAAAYKSLFQNTRGGFENKNPISVQKMVR